MIIYGNTNFQGNFLFYAKFCFICTFKFIIGTFKNAPLSGDELNVHMSSSFRGVPEFDSGGCHGYNRVIMLAKITSGATVGLNATTIDVEVDIPNEGLPSFTIVGLPDKAVEEAKDRVRSAIRNSGADFPAKRITVNLAPADLPQEGPSYDLPIAIGILLASGQLRADVSNFLF